MDALRIKNLRCLTDTGRVPIRPITILVGRNSSGKSTFLRAFPLLRQSVETPRESPILWYHDRFVDFGSFKEALNEHATSRSISFEFEFPMSAWFYSGSPALGYRVDLPKCSVAMTLNETEGGPARIQSYQITAMGHCVEITIDVMGQVSGFRVNNDVFDLGDLRLRLSHAAFLMPTIAAESEGRPVSYSKYYKRSFDYWSEDGPDELIYLEPFKPKPHLPIESALGDATVELFVSLNPWAIPVAAPDRIDAMLCVDFHIPDRWARLRSPSERRSAVANAFPWLLAGHANQIISEADAAVAAMAAHAGYLAPLRATAQRGYRVQDLSVSEVDPSGDNLAMFLRSLSADDLKSFADFTRRHLDFDASLRIQGLHADILVRESDKGHAKNLVDVGSGYAQVLPLAAALWSSCVRKPKQDNGHASILAVEQPELHLHPAHQARLTRMFAGAMLDSRKAGRPVKLLIETHSEALVGGFGNLIHEKLLFPDDVQIAIFDQDEETRQTTVRLATYDEDGALQNWPYGFFNPVDDHREAAE